MNPDQMASLEPADQVLQCFQKCIDLGSAQGFNMIIKLNIYGTKNSKSFRTIKEKNWWQFVKNPFNNIMCILFGKSERSGSVVECLT